MSKPHADTDQALESLIPDYLNDRLNNADRQRFDTALAVDRDLREALELERRLQQQIKATPTVTQQPRFEEFAKKIERRRVWTSPPLVLASFAALALVSVLTFFQQTQAPASFETLTDSAQGSARLLRVVGTESADQDLISALINPFGLEQVAYYADANTWEFSAAKPIDLAMVAARLRGEEGVLAVRLVDATPR